MKTATFVVLRVLALTIVLFICFVAGGAVVGQQANAQTSEQAGGAALTLLAVCFLDVLVLTHLILRSRWTRWRLAAAVFFVFYGVMTFMSQVESAVFLGSRLPAGMLPRLFLMGAVIAAPFSILAVVILGRMGAESVDAEGRSRLVMPASEWAWKLVVIALAYLILYFTFGYYIVWRNPVALAYYAGVDEGTLFAHMGAVLRDTPWLVALQVVRAMCWVALAVPVIRMLKGEWPETALAIGVQFAVLMNAPLLLPNPYMPEEVRMTHLVETASSNFILGVLIGWLLTKRHAASRVAAAGREATA
jgi:hypothetical protein